MRIRETLQDGLREVVAFLPNLIGFLVLLLVGYVVAKLVGGLVTKVLQKTGVDERIRSSDANKYVDAALPGASVSGGVGKVVFYLIFVFFLFSAIGALKIPALTGFMNDVLAYLPNIIAAILIFVVAALVSGAVAAAVTKLMGDTPTGKIVATVVPAIVMVIAFFMILEQLQIAPEIVRIAFAAIMFALALGLALAFGLGGRTVAERLLEDGYRKGREQREQVRSDLQSGRESAQQQAQRFQQDDDTHAQQSSTESDQHDRPEQPQVRASGATPFTSTQSGARPMSSPLGAGAGAGATSGDDGVRRANPLGAYIATAGALLLLISMWFDWVGLGDADTEQNFSSGYEADSLIPFMGLLGLGFSLALLYAAFRADRRQHRGLSLASFAVGLASFLWILFFLIDPIETVKYAGAGGEAAPNVTTSWAPWLGLLGALTWAVGSMLLAKEPEGDVEDGRPRAARTVRVRQTQTQGYAQPQYAQGGQGGQYAGGQYGQQYGQHPEYSQGQQYTSGQPYAQERYPGETQELPGSYQDDPYRQGGQGYPQQGDQGYPPQGGPGR